MRKWRSRPVIAGGFCLACLGHADPAEAQTLITGTYTNPYQVSNGNFLVPADSGSPSATFDGGGLTVTQSTLTIAGGLFENAPMGGPYYILNPRGCNVHITGGKFTNNQGLTTALFDTSTVDISGGSFTNNNSAMISEGGPSTVTIRGGSFTNNRGVVTSYSNSKFSVYGGAFSGNDTDFYTYRGAGNTAPGGIIDIYGNFLDPSSGQRLASGQSLSLAGQGHFTGALVDNTASQSYSYYNADQSTVDPLARIVLHEVTRASFVKVDTTTHGNWKDSYGSEGYDVLGDSSTGNPHYRTGLTVTPGAHNSGVWASSSLDPRCLQSTVAGSAARCAGAWTQTSYSQRSWTMNVNVMGTHKLALYLLDFAKSGATETIKLTDAYTGAVLDTRSAAGYQDGSYYVWNVAGNVNITLTSPGWATVSGILFGGPSGSKSPTAPSNLPA